MKTIMQLSLVTLVVSYLFAVAVGLSDKWIPWGESTVILSLVYMACFQLAWGLIAGIISHRRGWRVDHRGGWRNLFGMIAFEGLFTIPCATIAVYHFYRYGKFIPVPTEC